MKVSGTHTLHASRQEVWETLQDPRVLVRTLPGCQQLEETGTGEYTATVEAGIASIKGTYDGTVRLTDQDEPHGYTLKASGAGGPGTIEATARVALSEAGDGATEVSYDADAVVGGTIAGVGQRVLASVAKRNAAEFFSAVDEVLTGERSLEEPEPGAEEPAEAVEPAAAEEPPMTRVYRRPAPAAAGPSVQPSLLLAAAATGAAIALLGVLVGRRKT